MANNKQKQIPKELRNAIKMDKELQETLNRIKNGVRYDFSQKCDRSRFERQVHNDFEAGNRRIKMIHHPEGGLKAIDREGVALKKRKQAVIDLAEYADTRFSSKYPDLCIPDELLRVNSVSVGIGFAYCDDLEFLSVAAALWILDRLQEEGMMEKAYAFLPDLRLAEEKVLLPPMKDTCHGDDVLCGMLYIVQHIRTEDDGTEMSPGQRFSEIIKLIDPYKIKRAVRRFEEKQWENFDAILYAINYHKQKILKLADEALATINICSDIHAEMLSMYMETASPKPVPIVPYAALLPDTGRIESPFTHHMMQKNRAEQLGTKEQMLTAEVNSKLDEIDDEEKAMDLACVLSPYLIEDPKSYKRIKIPGEYGRLISSLEVDDPFEICFAHLYMLANNMNSVWLYHQSLSVLFAAAKQLPWNVNWSIRSQWIGSGEELPEDILLEDDEMFDLPEEDSDTAFDDSERRKKLYQKAYSDKGLWVDPDTVARKEQSRVNLSQIVYAMTGAVMPRNTTGNLDIAERLRLCGMKKTQRIALEQYILLMNAQNMRTRMPIMAENTEPSECNAEELKEGLTRAKEENERLRTMLKEVHAERNAERKRANQAEQTLEHDRAELAELRSMIYDRSKLNDAGKETAVAFPYTVSCRIVIFGGHDVWLNCIRPLLKGVRYVSPTAKPNMSMLMNTDVIWLQTNVMGHSYYNKIVDTARIHNIPVKYFSYSGAEKCAEQLALDDMEHKKESLS